MNLASDALLPTGTVVTVVGKSYPITSFSFAKTVLATDLVMEILETAGLTHLMSGGLAEANDNVLLGKEASILGQILNVIPALLRQGIAPIYTLLGLVVTSNEDLEALYRSGNHVRTVLQEEGTTIGFRGSLEDVKAIISAGLASLSNEPLIKSIPNVVGAWAKSLIPTSTPA